MTDEATRLADEITCYRDNYQDEWKTVTLSLSLVDVDLIIAALRAIPQEFAQGPREAARKIIVSYFDSHGINHAHAGAFNILDRFKDEGLTVVALSAQGRQYDRSNIHR